MVDPDDAAQRRDADPELERISGDEQRAGPVQPDPELRRSAD
ncbi:hypothetical protein [Haloarchaeobius salinus]|nr:hypothetical protein [Haloarchaeobius salinus]